MDVPETVAVPARLLRAPCWTGAHAARRRQRPASCRPWDTDQELVLDGPLQQWPTATSLEVLVGLAALGCPTQVRLGALGAVLGRPHSSKTNALLEQAGAALAQCRLASGRPGRPQGWWSGTVLGPGQRGEPLLTGWRCRRGVATVGWPAGWATAPSVALDWGWVRLLLRHRGRPGYEDLWCVGLQLLARTSPVHETTVRVADLAGSLCSERPAGLAVQATVDALVAAGLLTVAADTAGAWTTTTSLAVVRRDPDREPRSLPVAPAPARPAVLAGGAGADDDGDDGADTDASALVLLPERSWRFWPDPAYAVLTTVPAPAWSARERLDLAWACAALQQRAGSAAAVAVGVRRAQQVLTTYADRWAAVAYGDPAYDPAILVAARVLRGGGALSTAAADGRDTDPAPTGESPP
jgi:hypothetical protein